MSLRIVILVLVLLAGSFNPAQGQSSAIHVGYGIVTVESGNSAGISPVETLTYGAFGVTTQTIVSPPPLLTNSALVVNLGSSSGGSTGIAIMNPATSTAHVQLSVTDPQGIPILIQTIAILPNGQISRFLNETFAGQITAATPRTGLLTVTSDTPVGLVALNFLAEGFASSPLTSLSSPFPMPTVTFTTNTTSSTQIATVNAAANQFTTLGTAILPTSPVLPPVTNTTIATAQVAQTGATIGGSASFLFPQVVTGGGWLSEIAVANTSSGLQTIRIDFFDPNGALLESVTGVTIPSRGLFKLVR